MRILLAIGMWLMATGLAMSSPDPSPPDDFGADQYIDSKGCVFLRDGSDWIGRRDDLGRPLCGFPPSLSSRRTDPDTENVLPPMNPSKEPSTEAVLLDQLAQGLRQGEFVADDRPPAERRKVDLRQRETLLEKNLNAMVEARASLNATLAGAGESSSDLCSMLGYRASNDPAPVLGGDVTQGLCPGMRAPTPAERILKGQRVSEPAAKIPAAVVSVSPLPPAKSLAVVSDRRAAPAPAPAGKSARPVRPISQAASLKEDRRAFVKAKTDPAVEMIPASARYVLVGAYRDDENAVATIRRLSELGYRVGQSYRRSDDAKVRLIMAGPFSDRRALIAALNRLRASGYPKATTR